MHGAERIHRNDREQTPTAARGRPQAQPGATSVVGNRASDSLNTMLIGQGAQKPTGITLVLELWQGNEASKRSHEGRPSSDVVMVMESDSRGAMQRPGWVPMPMDIR